MADATFTTHLDEVLEDLDAAMIRGLEACGFVAETYAKEGCPVDTGRLKNSIAHAVVESEKAAYIGTKVEYAPPQEFNDNFKHKTGGPHFLKNAAGNHTNEYKEIVEDSLKNA